MAYKFQIFVFYFPLCLVTISFSLYANQTLNSFVVDIAKFSVSRSFFDFEMCKELCHKLLKTAMSLESEWRVNHRHTCGRFSGFFEVSSYEMRTWMYASEMLRYCTSWSCEGIEREFSRSQVKALSVKWWSEVIARHKRITIKQYINVLIARVGAADSIIPPNAKSDFITQLSVFMFDNWDIFVSFGGWGCRAPYEVSLNYDL